MSQFTLTAVDPEPRIWEGDHGKFAIYTVQAEGDQGRGEFETKRKAESPAPQPGDVLDAEIVTKGGRKPELKRIYQQNGAGGGSGSGRGGWTPEKERSIVRQHSQEMAIRLLVLLHARGKIPEDAGNEFLVKYIDFFQRDAEGGGVS